MYCSPLYIHQPSIDVKAEQNGFVGLNVSTTLCSLFVVKMLYIMDTCRLHTYTVLF